LSFSIETLQDFVVNLINDEAAKAAYAADPLAALKEAGLADLTPADVQEVLPLVADSLPAGVPGLADLPAGFGGFPVGLPELGDLPVAVPSLPVDLPSVPPLETPFGDVTAVVGDAAATVDLDGDVLSSATSGFLANSDNSDAPTVSNYTETVFGDLAAGAKLDTDEFGGSISGNTEAADAGLGLVGHTGGDLAAWGALDTVAGDLGGGVLAGPDGFAFAAESPLGDIEANSAGDFALQPADTADLLDVDHLGDTGDAVAGTVAHYVGAGAGAFAGGVATGADTLGGFLTGPVAPVGHVVESGADTVTRGIEQGGDSVSEHLTDLPAVGGLPLDQLPELPQLPDLPDIDSGHLPQLPDVSDHLPTLPVDLPDTGAVTGLVTDNPVTDVVHTSPVGGLLDGVTGHLPQVADLPGDLDLGL
jgi:hypothetical protein